MADLEALKSADQLKWSYLSEAAQDPSRLDLHFDERADMLILRFISPQQLTVVFYADDNVGLLIDPETMNVVGFQIEAFKRSFMPHHDSVRRVWRLSETGLALQDFGDVILTFEQNKKNVAREVIRATADVVGAPAVEELVAALA